MAIVSVEKSLQPFTWSLSIENGTRDDDSTNSNRSRCTLGVTWFSAKFHSRMILSSKIKPDPSTSSTGLHYVKWKKFLFHETRSRNFGQEHIWLSVRVSFFPFHGYADVSHQSFGSFSFEKRAPRLARIRLQISMSNTRGCFAFFGEISICTTIFPRKVWRSNLQISHFFCIEVEQSKNYHRCDKELFVRIELVLKFIAFMNNFKFSTCYEA